MRNDSSIHCTKDSGDLSSVQDLQSWQTLVRAAEIRQYAPILDLAKTVVGEELPTITYHRKYRSTFTMKRDLDNITVKREFNATSQNYQKEDRLFGNPQQKAQRINEFAFSVTKLVRTLKAKMYGRN